ncbi:MAG TPA: sugar phosphate nucleotidyltransferase, partial [Spirochaetia bacterium]|nr:sugar phosphate nucleotidyltransferase [Spirochaetia bacterium]
MDKIVSIVLAGGKGQRLHPLTAKRSKPAVPFGGKFRLVDIPISNCMHAGFREIYILTQYNSASLHRHINNTYRFDAFGRGFVEVLAAVQTPESEEWYQGTADAVRQNFLHFADHSPTHYLILSGDQLYRMDLHAFFDAHVQSKSDVTVACLPVTKEKASSLGILQLDERYHITRFVEKPPADSDMSSLAVPRRIREREELDIEGDAYLASMGIYVFSAPALAKALDNDLTDFGSQVIPASIEKMKVSG